jgi:hypothetical protein
MLRRLRKIHTSFRESNDMPQFETVQPATPLPRRQLRRASATPALLFAIFAAALGAAPSPGQEPAPAAAAKQPKLVVEEQVHETGEVARDKVVEHAFKIRNAGDAPLVVGNVIAPPNLEILGRPTSLAPGESGEIRVRVPLLLDRPLALLKQIGLETNDPTTPSVVLELKILSTEYVVGKPGYARWIAVQQEKSGTISQRIVATDGQDFELLRTSELPLGITSAITSSRKDPASPREWKVDLTLGPDAPVGPIVGTLLLYVTHPKQSIVPIPLSGFMRPVIAVTPTELKPGEVQLTKKLSQAFNVKAFSTEPIHVTKVEHDLPGVAQATMTILAPGREHKIKLEFDPATVPKGLLRGTLRIFTDSAKVPQLTVPIELTVK